jgi:hypothetical protein
MARKHGKMALYEVMSKARVKSDAADKTVEPLKPKKKKTEKVQAPQAPVVEETIAAPEPQLATKWRKKPRIVQYNLGRFEFSIPYQLAITAGLALILMLLLAFRFGQYSNRESHAPVAAPAGNAQSNSRTRLPGLANAENLRPAGNNAAEPVENRETAPATAAPRGGNVIVLAQLKTRSDLVPAMEYFNKNIIPTEIAVDGNWYVLQTVERFKEDPANPGTKGYELIQKIKEIGKGYKAPQGYDTFSSKYFSDAYGKKVEN